MIESSRWYFIEFSFSDVCEVEESKIKNILKKYDCEYRMIVLNTIIFDIDHKPALEILEKLREEFQCLVETEIERFLRDKVKEEEDEETRSEEQIQGWIKVEMDNFGFEEYEEEEILFSFLIKEEDWVIKDFLVEIEQIENIQVYSKDYEYRLIKRVDYNLVNDFFLIHNIRKRNVAIINCNIYPLFIIVGYMESNNQMYITIKAFQYDILRFFVEGIMDKFAKIEWQDNICWKWLLSRVTSKGYREGKRQITNNPLMQKFLKASKSRKLSIYFRNTLEGLLNKGYLTEQNLEKEFTEGPGTYKISENKDIISFLQKYIRIIKDNYPDTQLWVDPATGLIYSESKDAGDQERIKEFQKYEIIYAPNQHLLHYIRAYWHQQFVEQALVQVQQDWQNAANKIQIIDMEFDIQVDLISDGIAQKSSYDIDCLIRLKNINNLKEFIIGIESKRNSSEFQKVKTSLPKKMTSRYVPIFNGFIVAGYFSGSDISGTKEDVNWEQNQRSIGKQLILCSEYIFDELVNRLKKSIICICEST